MLLRSSIIADWKKTTSLGYFSLLFAVYKGRAPVNYISLHGLRGSFVFSIPESYIGYRKDFLELHKASLLRSCNFGQQNEGYERLSP